MGPGKAFGELAILYNCTRTASVKGLFDSEKVCGTTNEKVQGVPVMVCQAALTQCKVQGCTSLRRHLAVHPMQSSTRVQAAPLHLGESKI
ncbi:hypothetical protein HPB49_010199 [Dermacentor silvarum]|uniref:Uncharacterized protein n=1 Tax=Dermacentor silvarum TaxID=543639 RepID=A0ACB8DZ53_DERSI|nr:hypothetical protein HPB49_010199 [Dermacentor silvarum]